ncbi:3'-5' exoribonuclease [Candidatus Saccharibacteria bacterium]|nr:3'-5' exoribonuclease [Candidatus Saccharibacteria bacterium]
MRFEPFERKNIIFIDTEFTDLDPYKGEILSIGIVKLNGEELYIELESNGQASDWVQKHILKMLDGPKFSREQAVEQIQGFLGSSLPFAAAFVDNYDVIYLTKLFGAGNLPFRWMTIDIASVLFAMGINPVKYQLDKEGAKAFYKQLGIDTKKFRHHHALDDARLLREVWLKLIDAEE